MIVTSYGGAFYLFECAFDTALDEYPDYFTVYRLPTAAEGFPVPDSAWRELAASADLVGRVSTADVEFDPTIRRFMNGSVFARLGMG